MSRRGRGTIVRAGALAGALAGAAAGAWALRRRARTARPVLVRPTGRTPATSSHREGTGTPLVLLHGITATWRVWEPLLPRLTAHHDVLALTLAGHDGGATLAEGTAASVNALVDGVEAELDRLGLGAVHLVGNSLGGWVAIELARRGRARSLVLFSPAGAYTSKRRMAMVTAGIGASLALLARLAPRLDRIAQRPAGRRALAFTQVAHPELLAPDVVADTARSALAATIAVPLLRVLVDTPLDPLPADHPYPIRLVWAQPDRVIPYAHFGAPMLAKLPGAELIRQPGIGHVPMSDDPALVSRLITEVTTADRATRATP
ncbi:MAG: alpha/beta fold hydrolase [Pseudonocardia sp.]